jgi:ABC-2 type transport system ATP-binding protein
VSVIQVRGLTKRFGATPAVDNLTFDVPDGTVTGFLGLNGAGKTTTLRMLLGLARPSAGTATVYGRPYAYLDSPARRIGAVREVIGTHPGHRARDHLRILAAAAKVPSRRADEVLELVGLGSAAYQRVGGYSMGMRQRLGLAAALLGEPDVLILDEPLNGLDPAAIRWLRGFLRSYAAEGRTVLVSSHMLAEVAQTVDHVLVIHQGRLVADATRVALTIDRSLEDVFFELTGTAPSTPAAGPAAHGTPGPHGAHHPHDPPGPGGPYGAPTARTITPGSHDWSAAR